MQRATQSPRLIRFESFEVNLCSAELFRTGEKIRLPEQSFQILTMLLEKPGELVTRQDIQKRLWPHDTVVEFENSINAAIKRLRVALGDSADQPRYIETLARRGYRWMVNVERVEGNGIESLVHPPAEFVHTQSAAASLLGRKVSHYRVLEIVGGGGMGVVYKAEDLKLGRRVALKFLPEELANNAAAMERFEREARAASTLNHPNICTLYEVEEHAGQPFMVMELLGGQTLRELISSQQPLPDRASERRPVDFKALLPLAIQIAEGLEAAHKQGIIHRDIKPANIFITSSGQAKILDFGLAKLQEPEVVPDRSDVTGAEELHCSVGADLTLAGVAMGTAAYMSPEQVRGEKLDARTDLFSFGLVLYEMVTGQRAFSGDTAPVLHESILKCGPVSPCVLNPELPSRLVGIIDRALQKDREVRYQSATEILTDLKSLEQSGRSAAAPTTSLGPSTHARSPRKYWLLALGCAVVAGIVSLGIGYYLHRREAVRLTEKDTIVLGDFSNSTGDPIFDDTLKQALSIALQQSPFLNILPDRRVRATLKLMTKPPSTPLNPEVARELCQRSASKAYVLGAIANLGNEYVLGLKAVNCQTGDILAKQQATVESKDKVMDALGDSAIKLRNQLGESLVTVGKFDVPLKQATTPSLEALKAYSLGNKAGFQKGPTAALPYHLRAIQLDPNFAMAYLNAGVGYYILGEIGRSTEYYSRAFQLREHASERERLLISSMYYYTVTGELDRASEAYEEIIHNYPREVAAYGWLGLVYAQEGQYDKAVETALTVLPLAGDNLAEYEALSRYYLALQRFDEAHRMLEQAHTRRLESGSLNSVAYALAFIEGDSREIEGHAAWFQGKRGDEDSGLSLQSDTEAYRGSLRKSRELTKRAVGTALHDDSKENAAMWTANAAVREAEFGNVAQARQAAAEALRIAPTSQGVEIEAALAFAVAGDIVKAESLVQDLGRRFPLNTQLQSVWLPTINAELALQKSHPTVAINQLRLAGSMELGYTPIAVSISCLYPAYERGKAYLAADNGSAAATEFQKIIDHRGIVWNCPIGALAHLGLARANALQAHTDQGATRDAARARASAAYSDFLALWRDADPDIPLLSQAKAEYARLQ